MNSLLDDFSPHDGGARLWPQTERLKAAGITPFGGGAKDGYFGDWYFTNAALTPDFCAISESDTSIEERSIISSLAATSSFSAVVFLEA